MSNWQTTAKTIFCDSVDDEVTVLLHKDGRVSCTGFKKYNQPNDLTRIMVKEKTGRLKIAIKCEGQGCRRVTGYKTSILAEETR